jgi:hypothetical protein
MDIVHAAVTAAGAHVDRMSVQFSWDGSVELTLHLSGRDNHERTPAAGRRVLAALGVTDATLGPPLGPPGDRIADLTAVQVPALDGVTLQIVVHLGDVLEAAPDDAVDALVAAVDAARAAEASGGGR